MRLSKKKLPSKSFLHPLHRRIFPLIKEEENEELISKIRHGDQEAAHRVVLGHVQLSLSIVGRYLMFYHQHRCSDDLVSAAMEGLCAAVDRMKTHNLPNDPKTHKPHTNLTGYLVEYIHGYISKYLEQYNAVRVPRTSRRDSKKNLSQPLTFELTEENTKKYFYNEGTLEGDEILDKITYSSLERKIIIMRMERYSYEEIGKEVGLVKSYIFTICREIEKRFLREFPDD